MVTISETQLSTVLNKLDMIRLELLRLRAMLLPKEELSETEKKELIEARREAEKNLGVSLETPDRGPRLRGSCFR